MNDVSFWKGGDILHIGLIETPYSFHELDCLPSCEETLFHVKKEERKQASKQGLFAIPCDSRNLHA